jgi:hypothetical protein
MYTAPELSTETESPVVWVVPGTVDHARQVPAGDHLTTKADWTVDAGRDRAEFEPVASMFCRVTLEALEYVPTAYTFEPGSVVIVRP